MTRPSAAAGSATSSEPSAAAGSEPSAAAGSASSSEPSAAATSATSSFAKKQEPEPATPPAGRRRILILGGGFAGVYTAKYLWKGMTRAERGEIDITIVSNENYIVFQPLLPEVISGTINSLHCISPIRRLAPGAQLYTREIEAIDLVNRTVRLSPGFLPRALELKFDHLVVGLGMRLNFEAVPGMREHATPFKYLGDALRLRNEAVRALEEGNNATDPEEKRRLLTFVVGGGGFSGVECIAELNDFLASAERAYPNVSMSDIRCVLLQGADRILPELGVDLAAYAHKILAKRGVEILLNTRLKAVSADAAIVANSKTGVTEQIFSRTIVTTVPAAPHPLVQSLPVVHVGGRIKVNPFLQAQQPGTEDAHAMLWAIGDCAAVPQKDGIVSPPTAQHALRQAQTCATNILATLRGTPLRTFDFTGVGKLASLGHRSAVAEVMGIHLRGLIAFLFWRAVYLVKFPGVDRQIRIATDWLLDMLLPRDITQLRIFPPDPIIHEHFHAGETIFRQGDLGNKLYVVLAGQADVMQGGRCVATLGKEEIFGEVALISEQDRNANLVARSDLDTLSVSREAFQQLVKHLPGARRAIIDIMRKRGIDAAAIEDNSG